MDALKISKIFSGGNCFAAFATVKDKRLVPGCSVVRSDLLGHALLYGGARATGTCNGTSNPTVYGLCPINCLAAFKGTMKVDMPGKFSLNVPSLLQCSKDLAKEITCNADLRYVEVLDGGRLKCEVKGNFDDICANLTFKVDSIKLSASSRKE